MFLAGIVFSYVYQDKIVNQFVKEANNHLLTPIKVDKISFSIVDRFPNLSIVMEDVYIRESIKNSKEPLGVANKIYLTLNLKNLLFGKYVVDQVVLENAEVKLRVTKKGKLNYKIAKQQEGPGNPDFRFDISKIKLKNVAVTYHNERKKELVSLVANATDASLSQTGQLLTFDLKGDLLSNEILIDGNKYFHNKEVAVNSNFSYDLDSQLLEFNPSDVKVNEAKFIVKGNYLIAKVNTIDMDIQGENTSIQTLFSILPEQVYHRFSKYRSKGDIYFNGKVKGDLARNVSPGFQLNFGCRNATFIYPGNNKNITNVNLTGAFKSSSTHDLSKARLTLNDVTATLDNKPISGALTLENFKNYYIDCKLKGELDVNSVLGFFPIKEIKNASGLLDVDVNFNGRVNDFKSDARINRIDNSGEINVQDLNFELKTNKLKFNGFNGNLIFRNNDLAINEFVARAGKSHFELDGYFKNFLAIFLSKKQPVVIEAKLKSDIIDLDELLSSEIDKGKLTNSSPVKYYFDITPRLSLNFNCDVNKLKFRRFRGNAIKGNLRVKNQVANTSKLSFKAAGGAVSLSGKVDARPKNDILIHTNVQFDNINVDSTFFIFENFNQDFLEDRHLKGQFYSKVNSKLAFNKNLKWYPNSLVADVETSIKNGELNNFEPMKRVAKYVRRESMDHLRFSEIKSNIHIENQIIYIPPMEVSSNVRTIKLQGTHTFGQLIKYDLKVPIRNPDKKDKDEAFGAIEDDGKGNTNLFLTIIGSTSDYKVIYNTTAVKQKIKADIKKEGQELKEVIKNKGKKKETIELNEDEYFDFDSVDVNNN